MKIVYSPRDDGKVGWAVTEDDGHVLASGEARNQKQAGTSAANFYRYIDRKRHRKWNR